jgi:Putative 2OG-Fe(II) oxygenase
MIPRSSSWAVVYPGGGWQKPHIHDTGWLSGVYYVTAPKASGHNRAVDWLGKFENGTDPPGASETYVRGPTRIASLRIRASNKF